MYLFPHAGRFKCEVTELVFEMEDKGQVLYRIVSWDRHLLDGLSQKMPAGPLYSIDCLEGSVRELHLPHCETDKDKVELTVAHVTGGNLEIIPPLRVTNTHVVINIKHLSCFGLLRALLPIACPINAQVLLFYEKGMSTLYIHLVPGNVPFQKVQQIHESSIYIMTTSKCQLTPGKIYRPLCKTDHDYVAQPEDEVFEPEHYNNYHPTFEVLFYTEVNSVKLSISDKNGQVVWRPREVRFKGTEAASANMDTAGADFVDKHRKTLIQSVTSVMEIADCLYSKNMISYEMYSNIKAKATPQDQMRELYTCLNSKRVKAEFYKILREKHHYLVEDLEKGQA
ncbi:hypothetical protein AMELA_G00115440 [Ameiurus melas]|uniref:FIIND domain-containing protein n=1 Tax=Ameiurus melas TaxID=219545 RepID=A0A7J6AT58_AMEME|nr:hypothetical protein AMELA_G00115440 [Ameiurus melas]